MNELSLLVGIATQFIYTQLLFFDRADSCVFLF